tara:strand:- start:31 stop:645 length:615 start_codon:yes stop_codon:yes gene_type:complete
MHPIFVLTLATATIRQLGIPFGYNMPTHVASAPTVTVVSAGATLYSIDIQSGNVSMTYGFQHGTEITALTIAPDGSFVVALLEQLKGSDYTPSIAKLDTATFRNIDIYDFLAATDLFVDTDIYALSPFTDVYVVETVDNGISNHIIAMSDTQVYQFDKHLKRKAILFKAVNTSIWDLTHVPTTKHLVVGTFDGSAYLVPLAPFV